MAPLKTLFTILNCHREVALVVLYAGIHMRENAPQQRAKLTSGNNRGE